MPLRKLLNQQKKQKPIINKRRVEKDKKPSLYTFTKS